MSTYFGTFESFVKTQRTRQQGQLDAVLATLDSKVRVSLISALADDIRDLGLVLETDSGVSQYV